MSNITVVQNMLDELHDAIVKRVIDEPRHTQGERAGARMACTIVREYRDGLVGNRASKPSDAARLASAGDLEQAGDRRRDQPT